VIAVDDIRARYRQAAKFLDERGCRLFAANEALALGHGGVTAASAATGLARSTIRRAVVELQVGSNPIGQRIRRPGGGRKRAVVLQPDLPAALEALIEEAIRGDPETPLRWVSRSQRQIARTLFGRGFQVSQKLVGLLLRELGIVNFVGFKAYAIVRQYGTELHAAIWTHVSCRHTRKASARARRYCAAAIRCRRGRKWP
jgi:hypothetical protein